MKRRIWLLVPLMAACIGTPASADDRADYNRRSAGRYSLMFSQNDLNKDNLVTMGEAQGVLELQARFDDIDTNRDGVISLEEMTRYIETKFR